MFVEVKGRIAGAVTFTVTRNEILHALERARRLRPRARRGQPRGRTGDRIRYLRRPFGEAVHLPFATTSTNLSWLEYWERGTVPA